MEKLYIEPKKDSPEVIFDPKNGNFSITGISHPENVATFFEPLFSWLEAYFVELGRTDSIRMKPINVRLFFKYINSATFKQLVTLMQKFKQFVETGYKVNITWQFEPDDEDMKEAGYELIEISGINTTFSCEVCNN